MFQHPSLNIKIDFGETKIISNKQPNGYKSDWPREIKSWPDDFNYGTTKEDIHDFKFSLDEEADFILEELPSIGTAHILLTAQSRKHGGNFGIAVKDSICDLHTFNAVTIVKWNNSVIDTAQTLAHEIGHLIGMSHDFTEDDKGRNKTCGPDKWEGDANNTDIMNYGKRISGKWSNCSNEDLKNYYSIVSAKKSFCLNSSKGIVVLKKCFGAVAVHILHNGILPHF